MSNPKNVKIPSKASYKLKYKLLKRCIKEIVLVKYSNFHKIIALLCVLSLLVCNHNHCFQENAALCDRASEIQNQILISQEERKFLWKKYSAIQGNSFISGNELISDSV